MRISTLFGAALFGLFVAGVFHGVATVRAEDLPTKIRISTGAGSPFGKPYSGANSGLTSARHAVEDEFAKDGVVIEWQHLKGGGPASNEALASGAIDIGYAGEFPAIYGRAGGLKTRFIGGGFRGNNAYLFVPVKSSVTDIAALKGKKIGMQKGQPWEYGLDNLLRSKGLTETDFQILDLSVPDGKTALAQGDIDAFYGTASGLDFVTSGVAKIAWSTREAPRDWLYVADFFVADEFAQKYPTAVKRFLKAVIRTSVWATKPENAEEVYQTFALQGFPVGNFRTEYGGTDMRFRFSPIPDEFLVDHYKRTAAYMLEHHLIRRPVDVDAWVDRSFVDAALKELNLVGYWPEYDKDGNPKPAATAKN